MIIVDTGASSTSGDENVAEPNELVTGGHRLPSQLDLTAARKLQDEIRSRLASGAVVLDAGAVDRLSTPCVQVLLAAGRAAASADVSFRIANASGAFSAAVVELGLETQFRNWMV
ncbi:anti-anti-sigma factor [Bradyrhizobium sp. Y36]|uniref:STAS domain-containing protein n=1 Tax=Bradyrhizobium sp. Y36 TaxID=2035447 RepID=UPI000BEA70DD|nr:STAS domain-containing protein [Bradyrhizobium sp. Y36]PDT88762.1 anti-anti-sigma factor [Bradyrhizobium sp. Y36]